MVPLRGGHAQTKRPPGWLLTMTASTSFWLQTWLPSILPEPPGDGIPTGHYLLWRLSWLHARQYADASIA
jgi:hypothetical protein